MLNWEWIDNPIMVSFWIHLLLTANYEDKKWHGMVVPRGSLITGRAKMAEEIGISEQQVRTCLERLKINQQIDLKVTNKYTMITICNYDTYQVQENIVNQQITSKSPTNNQQITTTKELKKEKKETISKDIVKKERVKGRPDSVEEVAEYCKERANGIDPAEFFDKGESVGWVDKNGNPYKDWKAVMRTWEKFRRKDEPVTQHTTKIDLM